MGNLVNTIKKFVKNKNTVTILCILAGVVVLYFAYKSRVERAMTPIRVPYAKVVINAAEEITEDKIDYVNVSSDFLKKADIHRDKSQIVGKYVTTGTSIPVGGLFYKQQVVDRSSIQGSIYDNIPKGEKPFYLNVSNSSMYSTLIKPGDKIDLYLKAKDQNNKLIYGRFVEGVDVIAVLDRYGNDVYTLGETKDVEKILFSTPDEIYDVLKYVEFLTNVDLIPVPNNADYNTPGQRVTNDALIDFIKSNVSAYLEE